MKSIYLDTVLKTWESISEPERRKIIFRYTRKHGESFTRDEFFGYLEKCYRSRLSSYALPLYTVQTEF
jgi:hypothetical protein